VELGYGVARLLRIGYKTINKRIEMTRNDNKDRLTKKERAPKGKGKERRPREMDSIGARQESELGEDGLDAIAEQLRQEQCGDVPPSKFSHLSY